MQSLRHVRSQLQPRIFSCKTVSAVLLHPSAAADAPQVVGSAYLWPVDMVETSGGVTGLKKGMLPAQRIH
jgi:hypothetical protein